MVDYDRMLHKVVRLEARRKGFTPGSSDRHGIESVEMASET